MSNPFSSQIVRYEAELRAIDVLASLGLSDRLRVDSLTLENLSNRGIKLSILRADLLHPVISGNKWFKLKYNLLAAKECGSGRLVSFGGAWSNHLHALAYCCKLLDLPCCGVVRGEELSVNSNPMLEEAHGWGMDLQFVSRQQYRDYRSSSAQIFDGDYLIPEGGDNQLGLMGASTMLNGIEDQYTHLLTAVGTGCTFAGLRLALPPKVDLIGVSAVKGNWQLKQMEQRLSEFHIAGPWELATQYHRGGFGRIDEGLIEFCERLQRGHNIELEPVYTGKSLLALMDLVEKHRFPEGSHILFVHSGGLQGNRSYKSTTEK